MAEAGPVDALVNNAGVGLLNVLEGAGIAQAREVFETNVIGAMAMTHAVMPGMRDRKSGVIVNISSSVTLRALPALSIYSASKAVVKAFSESFALEAAPFDVRVRLVLPGSAPETSFGKNAVARMGMDVPDAYGAFVQAYFETLQSATERTEAKDVADATWRAVADPDAPMMQPVLPDAGGLGVVTAVLTAGALVQVRRLTLLGEGPGVIAVWFAVVSALGGLATLPWGRAWPGAAHLALLIGTGLAGGLAHIFMTLSFRHADASALALFEYLSVLWAVVLGFVFFAEVPGLAFLLAGPPVLIGAIIARPPLPKSHR